MIKQSSMATEMQDEPNVQSIDILGKRDASGSAILFATLFFVYCYFHQIGYKSPTPASRLDLLHAIWAEGTFKIDAYHENTSNKATADGHYYSDKAPGTFVMALPAFSLARAILALTDIELDSDLGWLISSWISCAGSLAIVTALGGVALFAWLRRWVPPHYAYVATLGIFLGAAPLPYCTLLMSHAAVVGLLSIAIWAGEWGLRPSKSVGLGRRDMLAGFCCGLALASEYSAGIAVVGIVLGYILSDFRRSLPLGLGMLPPLMLIPTYHWICFGTPLTFGYLNSANFTEMHEGFFGIKLPPRGEQVFLLLFGAERGLFFWSPILILVFIGFHRLRNSSLRVLAVTYLVPLLQVAAISAYFLPFAGAMIGPRLLAPILPVIALPVALGISRFPSLGYLLATISILVTVVATAVGILIPAGVSNPLFEYHVVRLFDAKFAHNLGLVFGLPGYLSLAPFVCGLLCGIWSGWRRIHDASATATAVKVGGTPSKAMIS
jgi:hypothetical protein